MSDRYDQMTDEELARHVQLRGVPMGPREVFPGRQIVQWLRERDRDDEGREETPYESPLSDDEWAEMADDPERIDATLTRADGAVETVTASVYTNEGRFGLRDFRTADDAPVVLHPGDSLNLPIVEIDDVARWEGPPP